MFDASFLKHECTNHSRACKKAFHLSLQGGMSWFTDLTLPAGLGLEAAIFPVALTTLYLSNIHVSLVLLEPFYGAGFLVTRFQQTGALVFWNTPNIEMLKYQNIEFSFCN